MVRRKITEMGNVKKSERETKDDVFYCGNAEKHRYSNEKETYLPVPGHLVSPGVGYSWCLIS